MVECLIVKWIVWLYNVDFFAWFFNASHFIRHAGSPLDISRVSQVTIRPISRIQVPPDPFDPDWFICYALCHVLSGKHNRDSSITNRADIVSLDGIRQHFRVEHILHGDLWFTKQCARMVCGIALMQN